jgi:hypothetical protein
MAAKYQGTPAVACIATRIDALEGQIERLGGKMLHAELHGIQFAPSPFGQAAALRRELESRIVFDFNKGFPRQGTLEFVFKMDSAYWYSKGVLHLDRDCGLLFTTDIQGRRNMARERLAVRLQGWADQISYCRRRLPGGMARTLSPDRPPSFRFGRWHRLSVSFGSAGRHIRLDGKTITSSGQTEQLGAGGTHSGPTDRPTIGESVSGFWPNNQHEGGFEGMLYPFRASSQQLDFVLNK